jgi:uncharacterized protein YndB with AHSA1/START domain
MPRQIRFEAVYPYSREEVWAALTDPVALGEWLMPNDFAPIIGHRFQFRTKPAPGFSGIVDCEVLELVAPSRLAFSWCGGGIETVVTFDVTQVGAASARVVMQQTGFKGMRGLMISKLLKGGWKRMMEMRLRAAIGRVAGGRYLPDPAAPESQCHAEGKEQP